MVFDAQAGQNIFDSNRMNKERQAVIRTRSLSIRISILALVLLASPSCHRKTPVPPPPSTSSESALMKSPPPAITPDAIPPEQAPLEPEPLPLKIDRPSSFDLGEMSFQLGNYAEAAKFYETFLNTYPKAPGRDAALLHYALCRALAGDSSRDLNQTEAALRKLATEFPKSRLRDQAAFILGLMAQTDKLRLEVKERDEKNKRLSEELQKLKEIDMQRRPSRTE